MPTTVAPRRARSTAILRPSPDDAPVTTATWPSYRFMRAATRPSGVPGPSGPAEALSFGPRQAEDTLADDVALDLRRAAGDRARERPQVLRDPGAGAPAHRSFPVEVDAVVAERFHAREVQPLLGLAAEQLEQRVLDGLLAPCELGEAAVAHELHGLAVDVQRCHHVAEAAVALQAELLAELHQLGHAVLDVAGVADPEHAPFVAQRALRDRPSAVQFAEEVLSGHHHVGEEHLVEVGVLGVGELGQGPAGDARRAHVDHQRTDALVLGRVGIGAHEAKAPVGVVRPRGPDLLAVDDEVVAVEYGPGRQAGQVAARSRLAHTETPGDLGPQRGEDPPLLLLVGAVVDDRRGAD